MFVNVKKRRALGIVGVIVGVIMFYATGMVMPDPLALVYGVIGIMLITCGLLLGLDIR